VVPGPPLNTDSRSGSGGDAELPGEAWQSKHAYRQVTDCQCFPSVPAGGCMQPACRPSCKAHAL
jgi:hypothetical protein